MGTALVPSADKARARAHLKQLIDASATSGDVSDFELLRSLYSREWPFDDYCDMFSGREKIVTELRAVLYEIIIEYRAGQHHAGDHRRALATRVSQLETHLKERKPADDHSATIENLKRHVIDLSSRLRRLEPRRPLNKTKLPRRMIRKVRNGR